MPCCADRCGHLAAVYNALDRRPEAIRLLQQALTINPQHIVAITPWV